MNKGMLIVLSGPAGVGKGTVCTALRQIEPSLTYSVSATTRAPRPGEQDGVNYFFKSREQFQTMIERDELLEYAEYVGNYYGTPADFVRKKLDAGHDVILEIEVQGALKVKQKFPEGIFIFLIPPSLEELRSRIVGRGTETLDIIQTRMTVAREELEYIEFYDYGVVNDRVENACSKIKAILTAEHCRKERILTQIHEWLEV